MQIITTGLILIVAALHFWFFALEAIFWAKPLGLRVFRNSPEKAEATRVLAANQGVYNAFLGAGLLTGIFAGNAEVAWAFRAFFLGCVIVAGIFGAITVSRRIFFVQSLPALIALGLTLMERGHS